MSVWVYPYKQGSRSARALAQGLRAKVIRRERSRFRPSRRKTVINWGCSSLPFPESEFRRVINPSHRVSVAANKLKTFDNIGEYVRVPSYTTFRDEAEAWDCDVLARTVLTGHSGQGVVYCSGPDQLVPAPLYVRYVKKKDEYRVHVISGGVIHVQKKMKRSDVPNEQVNYQIRNHANGFIYATDDANIGPVPMDVKTQALAAAAAMGLDFCAVDVIWNEKQGQAYVLEVNTAPGLTGTTLAIYTDAFNILFK